MQVHSEKGSVIITRSKAKPVRIKAQIPGPSGSAEMEYIFFIVLNYNVCLEKLLVLGIFIIITTLAEFRFSSRYWAIDELLFLDIPIIMVCSYSTWQISMHIAIAYANMQRILSYFKVLNFI